MSGGGNVGCGNAGGGNNTVAVQEVKPHPVMETLSGIQYCINTNPPLFESIILGFQHSFLTLGIITVISSLTVPQMGGSNHDKAKVIQSMMFVSGTSTLLQTLVGTRLPVAIGASHAFVIPMTTIVLTTRLSCINQPQFLDQTFEKTMAEMQGALLVSSVVQIILGFSGIWRIFVRYLSPLSMVPLITFTGLGLYSLGFPMLADCVEIGLPHLILLLIFSQYMSGFLKTSRLIFDRYAIIFTTAIIWIYALILTASGVHNHRPPATQLSCRTDRAGLMLEADWVYLPRPFQWGKPTVNMREATPIVFAGLVALIESTGTFIAAARYGSATPVPPSVISRGTFWLGIGTLLNAVFGAVAGPTASVESAGLLGLTRIGSRRVIQISAGFMLFFSIFGKFTAFFASVPFSIMAATYCILYAYVSSAGLNHLQFCNLNSFRTLFILGFSSFMAISVPQQFRDYLLTSNSGQLPTRSKWFFDTLATIFVSSPAVAIMVAILLDNTISEEEALRNDSGKRWWERFIQFTKDIRNAEFYSLPCELGNCFPSL
ncbi:hypothetical protein SOVF_070600 [Spinacia oleracea]|uniref:Nucleobase-ascorbate transporter 10 n=1 Tax=Spinacia oleracea TaxID=3562 RepID=A0A9R0JYM1_SPIOL|nr:putative nucleobase-ascorbate transporter 10 [Spinacia oleracea]KNA18457.1 hypothetical protein SOVF_070600 [Spinacia oleracea]